MNGIVFFAFVNDNDHFNCISGKSLRIIRMLYLLLIDNEDGTSKLQPSTNENCDVCVIFNINFFYKIITLMKIAQDFIA